MKVILTAHQKKLIAEKMKTGGIFLRTRSSGRRFVFINLSSKKIPIQNYRMIFVRLSAAH